MGRKARNPHRTITKLLPPIRRTSAEAGVGFHVRSTCTCETIRALQEKYILAAKNKCVAFIPNTFFVKYAT